MKRTFEDYDRNIPDEIWEQFPEYKKQIEKIQEMERNFANTWRKQRRLRFANNCEPAIIHKILRMFIRSHFVPAAGTVAAHFMVSIEGKLIDTIFSDYHFGSFFSSIKLVIDRRIGNQLQILEWNAATEPTGCQADCVRFQVFNDKPCQVKFYLQRNDSIQPRYDLSPALRELLPNLRWDPTEEDIIIATLTYLSSKGLMDGKDKSLIRMDPVCYE